MEKMGVMEPMEWTARMAQTELQVQLVRNHLLHSEKLMKFFIFFPMIKDLLEQMEKMDRMDKMANREWLDLQVCFF